MLQNAEILSEAEKTELDELEQAPWLQAHWADMKSCAASRGAAAFEVASGLSLCNATLERVSQRVGGLGYDRSALTPGVVHIGVGGFHRAHQAVYFDELARLGLADGWGMVGVGLRSVEIGEVLRAQDCLYLVVERGPLRSGPRLVGAMVDYLHGATQQDKVLEVLTDPRTRIVTLTITGNGYVLDAAGEFTVDDPTVAAEMEDPGNPDTVFGFLVEALDCRRRAGTGPFTVLSCDNIPANGEAARAMVGAFARLRDPELAEWIEENVTFPSSMVDRITPETTPEQRDQIATEFGIEDRWPVLTESYSQWVIEDSFCAGRPPLEEVGVQFVTDVAPYELAKKRLLNASHCALGYLGYLAGHRTSAEVMADPVFNRFLSGFLDEVIPLLPEVEGLDFDQYKTSLLERLGNPEMADQLSRLCRRGTTKMPSYLLPSIVDATAAGQAHPLMTLAIAGWFRYLEGTDYAGDTIDVEGARSEEFAVLALQDGQDPRPLLAERDVFGDLGDDEQFVSDLDAAAHAVQAGPREAIEHYLDMAGSR